MKKQFQEKKENNKKERRRNYLRNAIVFLAILNLILLYVFDYRVPVLAGLMDRMENRNSVEYSEVTVAEEDLSEQLTIIFEKDSLRYDGEGELDLLDGVSVMDESGNKYNNDNLTVEVSGDNKKEKTVRYTYSDKAGNTAEAERTLKLSYYDGPSIELGEELPDLREEDIDNLKNVYSGYYTAKDGFGLDITSSVVITAEEGEKEDGYYELSFQVTNLYGDTVTETAKVKAK